jgi:electron transfer flavoprotein beta subunit
MKILVAVKQVIDPYVKIRVKTDKTGVETQNVKKSMNPFDEIALEQAIQLKEQHLADEIIAVSIGPVTTQETLRHALALGATRAILVETTEAHCALNIAKIMQAIVVQESPDLVLMGKQSIDGDNNQTPQMLAGLLDWPQATYASELVVSGEKICVTREVDSGLETLELTLPCVVSTDLRLNEPRYASLPNIMKAKQKPLDMIPLSSLNLSLSSRIETLTVAAPKIREAGVMLSSVEALIDKLRHEAKVI